MNKILEKLIPGIPVALVLGAMMFSYSCANTTTPPSGGDKDTIPPVITGIYPLPGSVNVPLHNTRIVITFNEYVTVRMRRAFSSPLLWKNHRNIESEASRSSSISNRIWNRPPHILWI